MTKRTNKAPRLNGKAQPAPTKITTPPAALAPTKPKAPETAASPPSKAGAPAPAPVLKLPEPKTPEASARKRPTQEELPERSYLEIPRAALQAAVLCAAKDDTRYYLNAVLLHRTPEGDVRLVATNGHALLVQTLYSDATPVESSIKADDVKACRAWLEEGLLMPRLTVERTKILGMPDSGITDDVCLAFGKGHPYFTLSDGAEEVTLRGRPLDGKFPEYSKLFTGAGAAIAGGEREATDATCFQAEYVKQAARIAQVLASGDLRKVPSIAAFAATGDGPSVFAFPGRPGALLLIMPMTKVDVVNGATARLLGNEGLARSIAALKAHVTRHEKAAAETKDEATLKEERAAVERLKGKIAELLAVTRPQLEGPTKAEKVEKIVMAPVGGLPGRRDVIEVRKPN